MYVPTKCLSDILMNTLLHMFVLTTIKHRINHDWLWENPPLTYKDKCLEICNSII